mgnify:CR=1 FL=1
MINRELIRLKVVQLIYAYYRSERTEESLDNAEKELFFSFDKSYELYLYLLNALLQLKKVAESKEETRLARATRLGQSTEGVYAEKMFAKNKFLCQLDLNETLVDYREKQKKEWIEEDAFYKKLYATMVESDIYQLYLMARQIDLPLKSITLFLGNVHIYESNLLRTYELLNGAQGVKFELNI